MSKDDTNGFSGEAAETPPKKRAPHGEKTEQQKITEERAAQYPYKWPVDDQELRDVKDRRLRQMVVRNAIQYARRHAAINARKYMDECGIPSLVICEDIGILPDILSHAVNDELFSMPTDALVKFCYKYLHMSVQEFLFGKSKLTLLPRKLQAVARKLYEYQEEGTGQTEGHAKLCAIHMLGQNIFRNKMGVDWPIGLENCGVESTKTYIDRVLEYADDHYLHIDNIPMDLNAKVTVRRLIVNNKPMIRGQMKAIMRNSISCGATMDYFLVRDYTIFGTVAFVDAEGELREIRNRYALEIIGMLLNMTANAQDEYISKIIYRTRFEE